MLRRRAMENVTHWVAGAVLVLWAQGPGTTLAQESSAGGLEIGAISELDLEAVREIIELSDEPAPVADAEFLALSLEQAVQLSLERNLGLQVSVLASESSQLGIRVRESKFHPVMEIAGGAKGTKRGHSEDSRPNEFTREQDAVAGIQQQIPTGGEISVGVGYSNKFTDENYLETNGTFVGNLQTESEIAGLGIEIAQPLLRGGRIFVARKEILDAEYDNEISRAELNAEILSVTAETKTAYYRVIQTIRGIEVVEEALVRDAELVRASRALFEAGRVSKVEVYSAEINQAGDLARLASTKAEAEMAQNQLREVLGVPIDVGVDITDR
ncbi:MAG: TolC family protein, partial [Myxococcota bacterium]